MTSERRNTLLLVVLVLLTAGIYAWWWFDNHQLVEEEFRHSPSKEVRQNPFRAAQLFLEQKGYQVEISSGLNRFQSLPATSDMIIGEYLGGKLPEQRVDEVLAWVAEGGQLLTSVQRSWSDDNPGAGDKLLSKLGITLWSLDNGEDDEETTGNTARYFDVTQTRWSDDSTVQAEFNYGLSLYDHSDRKTIYLSSEDSNHLLAIPHGDGWVMLATDLTFMRNPWPYPTWKGEDSKPYINHRDHAFILSWLAESNETIWLVKGVDAKPLTSLLWQYASHAVIALLAVLLFWLWWQYNRFGPLRGSIIAQRRNILEHLLMSAVYAWRHDRARALFDATRKDIELLIRRKHPQIATLQVGERTAKLAEHCDMPDKDIAWALYHDWNGEREFIELTYLLQQIRKKL